MIPQNTITGVDAQKINGGAINNISTGQVATGLVGHPTGCQLTQLSDTNAYFVNPGATGWDVFGALSTVTWEFLIKLAGLSGVQDFMRSGGNTGGVACRLNGASGKLEAVKNYSAVPNAGTAYPSDGASHVITMTVNGASGTAWDLYIDGVALSTNPGTTTAPSPATGLTGEFFSDGVGGNKCLCTIGCITCYNAVLTPTDIAAGAGIALNGSPLPPAGGGASIADASALIRATHLP
jgi:hypothetical protein